MRSCELLSQSGGKEFKKIFKNLLVVKKKKLYFMTLICLLPKVYTQKNVTMIDTIRVAHDAL